MANSTKSAFFINSLLGGLIITGTLNTLVYKYQNTTYIDGVRFNHPYMQALCMFLGEAVCIFLYYGLKPKEEQDEQKLPPNYTILALPALLDGITSSLQHVALNFIPSSIYQMLRGGVMVVTAGFSIFFLKKRLTRPQYFGIGCTMLGISIVGASNFIFASSGSDSQFVIQMVSIALVILSLFTQAGQYVTEERIFEKYNIHPFMMVGGEGLWGLLYFSVVMPILNFLPCNFKEGCVFRHSKGFWECTDVFILQLAADAWLTVAVVLGIISIALFNLFGVSVTKYVSAVTRTVIDAVRTVLIWGIGLIVTKMTDRNWENTSIYANLLELFGFVLLVTGNLVYKGIVRIQWLERKQKIELLDEDENQSNQVSLQQ